MAVSYNIFVKIYGNIDFIGLSLTITSYFRLLIYFDVTQLKTSISSCIDVINSNIPNITDIIEKIELELYDYQLKQLVFMKNEMLEVRHILIKFTSYNNSNLYQRNNTKSNSIYLDVSKYYMLLQLVGKYFFKPI